MRRDLYVYSAQPNGPLTHYFRKSFEVSVSAALPPIGSLVPPACLVSEYGNLQQGVVTNVRLVGDSLRVDIQTQTSTSELRGYLIAHDGWEEVAG